MAVLPIGSFEQHGAHLPLATDTAIACAIANALADAYPIRLLPPVTIDCSHEHAAWPGTVSISHTTLSAIIRDVSVSLAHQGIHRLALVNGHGGNYVLSNIVQEANVGGPRLTLFPTRADWDTARRAAGLATTAHQVMHGGELEVSLLRHAWPESVRDGVDQDDHFADDRNLLLVHGMAVYTSSGIIGAPSNGTQVKGKAILDSLTASFATHLDALADRRQGGQNSSPEPPVVPAGPPATTG